MRRDQNKEYYAVVRGRVDEPTIFSSWGDAHPRTVGCKSTYKAFNTIEEARQYMKQNGVAAPKEIINAGAGQTTPFMKSHAFYAVAYGAGIGIYKYWYGDDGSKRQVEKIPGACHKHFRTRTQAEAFIEDWKQSVAELYHRAIRDALDQGFRPLDMGLSIKSLLSKHETKAEGADYLADLDLDKLSLKEKKIDRSAF